jgi:hypothetical protein
METRRIAAYPSKTCAGYQKFWQTAHLDCVWTFRAKALAKAGGNFPGKPVAEFCIQRDCDWVLGSSIAKLCGNVV